MLDTLVHGIDRGIRSLSEIFYGPVGSYCKLETVDRDALVADDGSLITVLRLEGALKQVGLDEHHATAFRWCLNTIPKPVKGVFVKYWNHRAGRLQTLGCTSALY